MRVGPVVAVCVLVAAVMPFVRAQPTSDMLLVPGGSFKMGTDLDDLSRVQRETGLKRREPLLSEVPAHAVTVGSFYMDVYDVTNRLFAEFTEAVPAWGKEEADESLHNGRYLEHWFDGGPPSDTLEHPVVFVTWHAAVAYCAWRDKRLPTEAEYEWAAMNPETGAEYPWGNAPPADDRVSWGGNGIDATVAVGSYPANSRGLYDMSGNVWHFTSDPWLGSYGEMLEDPGRIDEAAEDARIRRVVRGGSWGANAANLRVRYRDSHRPFDAREMVGFRCARSAE